MARSVARLSALEVGRLSKLRVDKIRSWHDGAGLYFVLDGRRREATGRATASWIYRYTIAGRARTLGLGPYPEISLGEARELATEARRSKARGHDPLELKDAERKARNEERAKAVTFRQLAEEFVRNNSSGWKNAKHAAQWLSSLKAYAFPIIGDRIVGSVDADAVLRVLSQAAPARGGERPFWEAKPETASRVRGRIEAVLDYGKVLGLRSGDNPAAWRGNLKLALPARSRVRKVKHHEALPVEDVPAFMDQLSGHDALSARALEFAVLTAARTGEVLGARWREIDLDQAIWTVPAARMKAGREHRIPLSDGALQALGAARLLGADPEGFVFPGIRPGKPLSNMAFLMLLRRMGRGQLTAHGFRSTFRDWVSEKTHHPSELAEMALAHTVADKVEAAYRRGDLFEKRRRLMADWGRYCAGDAVDIRPIQGGVRRP